tara:strand:- start:758 stop:922 length:165 start_codon:yes stop_codon:yes gene_type:complete
MPYSLKITVSIPRSLNKTPRNKTLHLKLVMKLQTKYHTEAATNNNVPETFNEAT